jgi:hypothetical protein
MAYDRYDSRRDWREARPRWRDDDREHGRERGYSERDRDERGWFERAGDEIASWFGDDRDDRHQRRDRAERFSGQLRNEDDVRSYYADRERGREREPRRDRAFMSDDDFSRFERSPRWRDEGYRRPYTGRFAGRQESGPDRGDSAPYRPLAGDYGRGFDERDERSELGGSFYGVGAHHDRHYSEWRRRQLEQLDRDYEDYARENRSRFEDDFSSWRERRQAKRGLLGQVREHMEVVGSDGEPVGTVDRTAGDRLILTKSDPESGGAHHSLMCTAIDRIEGDKVVLDMPAEQAKRQWRDENRERALFEREDQGEAGPHMLGRSFSGTY